MDSHKFWITCSFYSLQKLYMMHFFCLQPHARIVECRSNVEIFAVSAYENQFVELKNFVHKSVRSQVGGICPVKTFCGQGRGEVLQMRTSRTFWRKKLQFFRNLWCVCTDKGEGSQFFAILCGRLLWTAPNDDYIRETDQ